MERSLRTIAAFSTPEEAEVARIALEDEGIQSFLGDATTVGMLWHVGALGGVKLQVAEADVQRAREVLAGTIPSPTGARSCGHCGAGVPPGFDVCWSCELPVGAAEHATPVASSTGPEAVTTTTELGDDEIEMTFVGDAEAWRALAAAIIGIFLCPPLLSIYSIWTLLKIGLQNPPMSRKGTRSYYAAMFVDAVVCCIVGWSVLAMVRNGR